MLPNGHTPPPSILDIYVVWHPDDNVGKTVFKRLLQHYHSEAFSGFVGGIIEVYARSAAWDKNVVCPRTIFEEDSRSTPPEYLTVIPVIDVNMDKELQKNKAWGSYMKNIINTKQTKNSRILLCPILVDGYSPQSSTLKTLLQRQCVRFSSLEPDTLSPSERGTKSLERDVSQAITQLLMEPQHQLKLFISHTKINSKTETEIGGREVGGEITNLVLERLQHSMLGQFYDARSIQVESDWKKELRDEAATSPLLMIRTDMYSSRLWAQREVLEAKTHDGPIVALSALTGTDERGSFILDNVPTVGFHGKRTIASKKNFRSKRAKKTVDRAISRLVDETLKHELWKQACRKSYNKKFNWTPTRSPEPITLAHWLSEQEKKSGVIEVLYPDPPMTDDEMEVIKNVCANNSHALSIHFSTPRQLATQFSLYPSAENQFPADVLKGIRVGLSVSPAQDTMRMGMSNDHLDYAISEIARIAFQHRGTVIYGGGPIRKNRSHDIGDLLLEEARYYGGKISDRKHRSKEVFLNCMAWSVFVEANELTLKESERRLGLYGTILVTSPTNTQTISISKALRLKGDIRDRKSKSIRLAEMREKIVDLTDIRILLGGRLRFLGENLGKHKAQLGTLHEALIALQNRQPLYICGAYGGIGAILAKELGLVEKSEIPYELSEAALLKQDIRMIKRIKVLWRRNSASRATGLTPQELHKLALAFRPSEIMALVLTGVHRRQGVKRNFLWRVIGK